MDKKKSIIALSAIALGSLAYNLLRRVKSDVEVVEPFYIEKFLGTWYEIARLDTRWERNLKNVTTAYTVHTDGYITANNQGIDISTGKRKTSIGKVKQISDNSGALTVSFWKFIDVGYNIVKLDQEYQNVLVFGDNINYLWILSRQKTLSEERKQVYLNFAQAFGYDNSKLIWTIQD